jgi:hypothetical protein
MELAALRQGEWNWWNCGKENGTGGTSVRRMELMELAALR